MKPDRVVIGAEDERAAELMKELYAPFTRTGAPIMMMDCASAELCKYAANAMLATRISFMNEVAERLRGGRRGRRSGARARSRPIGASGPSFLFPGVGYGGSCFPKDVKAMLQLRRDQATTTSRSSRRSRTSTSGRSCACSARCSSTSDRSKGKRIAVWGLAFKPRTDDMREAPAVPLITALLDAGAKVQAYDPEAMKVAKRIFGIDDHLRRERATTRSTAPTRSPSSPSGTSSASPTSRGCGS